MGYDKAAVLSVPGFVLYCSIAAPVYAQGPCNLQTVAGTYVSAHQGSSLVIDPSTQPNPPLWFAPVLAPFADVAEITFNGEGIGQGFHWMYLGSVRPALDPAPLTVTITELKEDCTGKLQYTLGTPEAPGATITERFIVSDEGREIRSLPTSIVDGIPTLAWLGTSHRISKGTAPVASCGPHTAVGTYLVTCDAVVSHPRLYPTTAVADTLILRADVSTTGEYTGTLYEKLGRVSVERPAWGTFDVTPDCSFTSSLILIPDTPGIISKGIFFNEGKDGYSLGILNAQLPPEQQGIKYSFCRVTRIGQ